MTKQKPTKALDQDVRDAGLEDGLLENLESETVEHEMDKYTPTEAPHGSTSRVTFDAPHSRDPTRS